jgi:prephenate dehydrogenase
MTMHPGADAASPAQAGSAHALPRDGGEAPGGETSFSPSGFTAGRIGTLAVVGVGLIGGSFAAALRDAGVVDRVLGVGRNPEALAQAASLGLIDAVATLPEAAREADLLLLAAPVGATLALLHELAPHLHDRSLVTDAGSTKQDVVQAAREALGNRVGQFVPGHPIAGSHQSGPQAADAALYQGRTVILTPIPENTPDSVAVVRRAWESCGAHVLCMDDVAHDTALASVSHLPHLLSYAYMAQVAGSADAARRLSLAGSGFRDFTRLAASSPDMWRDIFLANREALVRELAEVRTSLDTLEALMQQGDPAPLGAWLSEVSLVRKNWHLS